jgi:hypothetical protein
MAWCVWIEFSRCRVILTNTTLLVLLLAPVALSSPPESETIYQKKSKFPAQTWTLPSKPCT